MQDIEKPASSIEAIIAEINESLCGDCAKYRPCKPIDLDVETGQVTIFCEDVGRVPPKTKCQKYSSLREVKAA